jgi:glycine/D-amino acid oxidase-like deaminating enzyme/nitrite reductase/ring-hydroxylating ferredoxin subunit
MNTESFWEATAPAVEFDVLNGDILADVCIVGGGITGITAAQLLSSAGKRVVVLEAHTIGSGTTGHSTGNLHVTPDEGLRTISKKWGGDVARAVARSRAEMVDHIEHTVSTLGLDCGFARRPHFIFPLDRKQAEEMAAEGDALTSAGLTVSVVDEVPLPASIGAQRALKIENQAQFHPLAYTRLLARALASQGKDACHVYEQSPAIEIDSDKGFVRTGSGSVRADHIVAATHTPKGFNLLQTDLGPYREYGIAARLAGDAYPEGIFWSLEQPSHSIRSFEAAATRYLLVIGEKHKTGKPGDTVHYYESVEAYARRHFDVTEVAYEWSGQHYRPADGLPYIGKTANSGRAFMATGFGTSGLLYGPVAAKIIADEILGRTNPFAAIYAAKRVTPIKSAKGFLQENVKVAGHYVQGWLTQGAATKVEALENLAPGEGRLVDVDGKKVAVYLDEEWQLSALSPACTHLQCIVHWNDAEKSWDCPCHGSRFSCTGEVLEGPALAPLQLISKTPLRQ